MKPNRIAPFILLGGLALTAARGWALDIQFAPAPASDVLVLADGPSSAPLLVETNNDRAVLRAAGDLAEDVARVTGQPPAVKNDLAGSEKDCVIIGTLGRGGLIDRLAAEKKIDVTGVRGEWESCVLQVVNHPLPGVARALVIAGSDRRGTIFGIYELSERIGVSPWYWWADVPVKKQNYLAVAGDRFFQGPPAVKYRGIFLNDEDYGLRPWAAQTFDPATGNIGPKTYAKIFELLLRLRANCLWPAMHPGSRAFNAFPENKDAADACGIVMGSSHCEPMLRNNVDEWDTNLFGEYNYVRNRSGVLKYWEQRVRANAPFESLYTLGMRGIHDGAMPGGGTEREKAARQLAIIADQREMLARLVTSNLAAVPQIFCPYKEVLPLYRLAPDIPDDITLVWPDDNFGYIRQFSNARERQRRGGAGVYYHISYWGAPYNYLWLDSTPPALIAEEMTKAFDYGAGQVWMLNVGDLKPGETGMEFFLRLAWNPHQLDHGAAADLLLKMAARDFGPELAPDIVKIWDEYYRLNLPRKPEHVGFDAKNPLLKQSAFSILLNGDEWQHRLDDWRGLATRRLPEVKQKVPAAGRDAFFERVEYPVSAAYWANEKAGWLTLYFDSVALGRIHLESYLEHARQADQNIHDLTDDYNHRIAGGKWRGMMSDHPGDQAVFKLPKITPIDIPRSPARLAVAVEGDEKSHFAGATNQPLPRLPEVSRLTPHEPFVWVFNAGTEAMHWTATTSADWLRVTQISGDQDARVGVRLDWPKVPAGDAVRGEIVFAAGGQKISVPVTVFNPATNPAAGADFAEDNRRVIIEAEHASEWEAGADAQWKILRGLGYHGAAVGIFPDTAAVRATPEKILAGSPCLKYRVWLRHAGDWQVTLRTLPTFSVETGQPQRYAIAWDDAPPQIISLPVSPGEKDRQWQENVLRNAALTSSHHAVSAPGRHTLKIWMVDPGIVIDALAAENHSDFQLGYTWPEETRLANGVNSRP